MTKTTRWARAYHYLMTQLSEASTWRGIIMLLAGCGTLIKPEFQEAIIPIGIALTGLIGSIFPDKLKKQDEVQ